MGVQLANIKKKFQDFDIDIELKIKNTELVTLLGPSGCGKTTTIQLVSGIIYPDDGNIFINKKNVTQIPVWQRNIGIVFQDYALFPHMNVLENISYGLKTRKFKKKHIADKVSEMLDLVHLKGYEERDIDSLSGGEKQRVALARALAPSPELLLLDEPLSALDAKLRTILRREIRRIQQKLGITTIYVTHDQDEALSISDRIILMNNGRIEQIGTPWKIYNNPGSEFSADFLGESNKLPCIVEKISTDRGISLNSIDNKLHFDITYRNGIAEGEKYLLFFRPQDTIVSPAKDNKNLRNTITGKILSTEYFGRYLAVKIKNSTFPIHAEISGGDNEIESEYTVGSSISVVIDSAKCWLIKE